MMMCGNFVEKKRKNKKAINAPIDLNVIVCVSGHFLASYFLAINFQFILQIKIGGLSLLNLQISDL